MDFAKLHSLLTGEITDEEGKLKKIIIIINVNVEIKFRNTIKIFEFFDSPDYQDNGRQALGVHCPGNPTQNAEKPKTKKSDFNDKSNLKTQNEVIFS